MLIKNLPEPRGVSSKKEGRILFSVFAFICTASYAGKHGTAAADAQALQKKKCSSLDYKIYCENEKKPVPR